MVSVTYHLNGWGLTEIVSFFFASPRNKRTADMSDLFRYLRRKLVGTSRRRGYFLPDVDRNSDLCQTVAVLTHR